MDAFLYNCCLLPKSQRDGITVVLVRPRNPLNIGAAARAMANFGFARLAVVAPYAPNWREARSAVGAPEVLADAAEFATLGEAVADCALVAGTASRGARKPDQRTGMLPELPQLVRRSFARGGRVALVFGPEKHGLTRDDLARCHVLVEIPTASRQPSMNLGQAVAVCLYELAVRGRGPETEDSAEEEPGSAATVVASGDVDRLAGVLEEAMIASGFSPAAMRKANRMDLQLLLRKLSFTEKDARRSLGVFRRILWRLRHPPDAGGGGGVSH